MGSAFLKKITLCFSLSFLYVTSFSMAQNEAPEEEGFNLNSPPPKKKSAPSRKKPKSKPAKAPPAVGTSLGIGIKAGATYAPTSSTYLPRAGLEFSLAPSQNLHFTLTYLFGSEDLKTKYDSLNKESIKTSSAIASSHQIQGGIRVFFLESFFFSGGIGARYTLAKTDFAVTGQSGKLTQTQEATSLIGVFGIGNEWRFESGFALGIEWLGVTLPLYANWKWTTPGTDKSDKELDLKIGDFGNSASKHLAQKPTVEVLLVKGALLF